MSSLFKNLFKRFRDDSGDEADDDDDDWETAFMADFEESPPPKKKRRKNKTPRQKFLSDKRATYLRDRKNPRHIFTDFLGPINHELDTDTEAEPEKRKRKIELFTTDLYGTLQNYIKRMDRKQIAATESLPPEEQQKKQDEYLEIRPYQRRHKHASFTLFSRNGFDYDPKKKNVFFENSVRPDLFEQPASNLTSIPDYVEKYGTREYHVRGVPYSFNEQNTFDLVDRLNYYTKLHPENKIKIIDWKQITSPISKKDLETYSRIIIPFGLIISKKNLPKEIVKDPKDSDYDSDIHTTNPPLLSDAFAKDKLYQILLNNPVFDGKSFDELESEYLSSHGVILLLQKHKNPEPEKNPNPVWKMYMVDSSGYFASMPNSMQRYFTQKRKYDPNQGFSGNSDYANLFYQFLKDQEHDNGEAKNQTFQNIEDFNEKAGIGKNLPFELIDQDIQGHDIGACAVWKGYQTALYSLLDDKRNQILEYDEKPYNIADDYKKDEKERHELEDNIAQKWASDMQLKIMPSFSEIYPFYEHVDEDEAKEILPHQAIIKKDFEEFGKYDHPLDDAPSSDQTDFEETINRNLDDFKPPTIP